MASFTPQNIQKLNQHGCRYETIFVIMDKPFGGFHGNIVVLIVRAKPRDETTGINDDNAPAGPENEGRKTSMIEWQLIETAPMDGTPILLWFPEPFSKPTLGHWDQALICWVDDYRNPETDALVPTHWVPLTPPV
jgi:hypothetical protein